VKKNPPAACGRHPLWKRGLYDGTAMASFPARAGVETGPYNSRAVKSYRESCVKKNPPAACGRHPLWKRGLYGGTAMASFPARAGMVTGPYNSRAVNHTARAA